jgi:hypothetical protein
MLSKWGKEKRNEARREVWLLPLVMVITVIYFYLLLARIY